jgi:anthranilate synthase component I
MKKIEITTTHKKLLADIYTPVGIYLRLRDKFRDTILLESADFHAAENSYSIIGINAIGGIEISNSDFIEYKLPTQNAEKTAINKATSIAEHINNYMDRFDVKPSPQKEVTIAQGLFGYTSYDAVQFFDSVKFTTHHALSQVEGSPLTTEIPLIRYRLYQYVIIINHFKDELFICENSIAGVESEMSVVESLIKSKDVPTYPFSISGEEKSNLTNDAYIAMVQKGIAHCLRGDVFQIVLSRKFEQKFIGDELNVYRALRSVNPSPYLFYFDYGDYKLMGSSPESQVVVQHHKAIVHPIAGTFKRTGNDEEDNLLAEQLRHDEKENAEHVMLVDLARNDLSKHCNNVQVSKYKQINYYSHVIHLVSEVIGDVKQDTKPFELLASTFPAGTLSGAPKHKAMQLINEYETTNRSYYGGAIGSIGFNGSINHAIMIRTFLSQNNTLVYQAGAGVVAASNPESELQEVNNKLNALKQAIVLAASLNPS